MTRELNKRMVLQFPFTVKTGPSIDGFVVRGLFNTAPNNGKFQTLNLMSTCDKSIIFSNVHFPPDLPDIVGQFRFLNNPYGFFQTNFGVQDKPKGVPANIDGSLCLKSYVVQEGILNDILSPFDARIVSFWFDLSISRATITMNQNVETGDVAFGDPNTDRLIRGTGHRFTLKSFSGSDNDPAGWEAKDPVSVRIESSTLKNAYPVVFDIDAQLTLLPEAIYDAIVGPVKKVVGNPLLVQGLVPDDAIPLIDSYTGYSERSDYFPCKYTKYLHAFKLNELIVQPEMIYDKADNGECILRVAPLYANRPEIIVVGFHLIKNHHTLVSFDTDQEPFLQFSKRRPSEKSILASCTIC